MRNPIARLIVLAMLAAGAAWAQLTVVCAPFSPPAGPVEVGVQYSTTCSLSPPGGTAPYHWVIGPMGATLPMGLTLTISPDTTLANISGAPTAAVAYSYRLEVADSSTPAQTGFTPLFTGTIAPAVTVTTMMLPTGIAGIAYPSGTALQASGGVPPYTWSISQGSLPPGLTLNPSSGAITGTPSMAGTVAFMATVADSAGGTATQALSITIVNPLMISCVPATGPTQVGVAYSAMCTASGGAAPYMWSISSGTLPPNLMLISSSGSSVMISGTPTTAGAYSYTVKLADSTGQSALQPYSGTIAPPALSVNCVPATGPSVVGTMYMSTCTASGGTAPYSWSINPGTLPNNLMLSSTSGTSVTVSGTPTAAGPYNYTVSVTDSSMPAMNAMQAFSGTIVSQLTVSCLPTTGPAMVQTAYSATCTASGGVPPYSWAISPGTLPAGLTLVTSVSTAAISGTPTSPGAYSYTVKVTDSTTPAAQNATQNYSGTIVPQLTISTMSLPGGTVGAAYSQMLMATGGVMPYTWSISAGSLPAGLTLNATTGAITGTPGAPGMFSFTAQVADSEHPPAMVTQALSINVVVGPLVITTNSPLPNGTVGAAYSQTLAATGGVPPYTWSVISGSLPANVSLNAFTGLISGMPTAANTFTFTVQLSDSASTTPATKQFSLTIASGLTITTPPTLPNATLGQSYSQTLQAAGGTPPYTWSIPVGALPAGLTLNISTGAISGTPTMPGTFNFTAQVMDSLGVTATKAFILTVASALSITTPSLPNGSVDVKYSQTLMASGGTPPYSWLITAGAPPTGTTLNATTGVLSGIPSSSNTFPFTVQVTDSVSVTASKQFTVTISSALTITTAPSLPPANAGTPYMETLAAVGGLMPYTWSVAAGSSLPAGLTLSSAGIISGTPTTVTASAGFTIQVTDSASNTASKAFTLTVAPTLTISTVSPLPQGEVTLAYSETLAATGGTPPYTWSVSSGSLPAGLTLSAGGAISGATTAAGTFSFSVQVTDSNSISTSKAFTLTIETAVNITTQANLNGGSVGSSYSQTLSATAGLPPYTWAVTGGALPGGLALSSAGVISGFPTGTGTFAFTARVTDAGGGTASLTFTIVIATGLAVSTPSTLPGATVGTVYSATLLASGGVPPYTWLLTAGTLPAGLTLSPSGVLSGDPSANGTFSFTVEVTDSVLKNASKQLSITVAPALSVTTSSLPAVALGAAYSQSLTATGGTPPYTWSISSGALPAGLSLSSAGSLTGMPGAAGTFAFTVEVTDSLSFTATKPLNITVTVSLSISTPTPLAGGSIGVNYSGMLTAMGGTPPYAWSITAGALPTGLSLSTAGSLTGTPTTAGTANFTVQVTDSLGATAAKAFTLTIALPISALNITTAAALPGATAASSYSVTLAAAGGTSPYSWMIFGGALPSGLTLNATTGVVSGTPTAAGNFTVTVQVTDSTQATASGTFTLTVALPPLSSASLTGAPATATSAQQLNIAASLASAYPLDITGEVTLTFQPDAVNQADDPSIQFSTGGRTATFTIAAGATASSSFSIQTGTVAGSITLTVTLQAGGVTLPTPTGLNATIQIAPAAPVISNVTATSSGTTLLVLITGYSNTREATQAVLTFAGAGGQTLLNPVVTVPLTNAAKTWFTGSTSDQYGSNFVLMLPFTVSSAGSVASVSVTLTNTVGTSNSMSASF